MDKITFLGADSTVFAKNILGDCITTDVIRELEYTLCDIDHQRLEESYIMLSNINRNSNDGKAKVVKYADRPDTLRGAKYVINCIQVGGYDLCMITDFEIPKKYGLCQTIGDAHGIDGMFRTLHTTPVMLDFAKDVRKARPDTFFINYTNPMSMLCLAMFRASSVNTAGLCHSHQACIPELLIEFGMPWDSVSYKVSGINHMAWLLEISRNSEDPYPIIRKRAQEGPIYAPMLALRELHPEYADRIPSVAEQFIPDNHHGMVRFEIMKQFGYFVIESSKYSSEYYPWFVKRDHPELIDRFHTPLDEYPRRRRDQIARWEQQARHLIHNENLIHTKSSEYAAGIIEALETDKTFGFTGNVLNTELIDNLPFDACVEVSCMVNEGHLSPCHMGLLPNQFAALNRRQIEMHQLAVDAILTRRKERIYQVAMLDPHAGSGLTIDETRSLVDDLIQARGDQLPEYH